MCNQKDVVVSFCIPVFNQSELVNSCLESIISYKGDDIEIIISDDCSSENIYKLIEKKKDKRIKYFKNDINVGHDLNILYSLKRARGQYGFLLRTRDKVISGEIPFLIEQIKNNGCVYLLSSAVDENNILRLHYDNDIIEKGHNALNACFKLLIHPSGSCYCLKKIDFKRIEDFLNENVKDKYGFVVHSLIRQELSTKGNFVLIEKPIWVYTHTEKQSDVAVNKTNSGLSVYDPVFERQRFSIELKWINTILDGNDADYAVTKIFDQYLHLSTWGFYYINKNKKLQNHYRFNEKKIRIKNERLSFYEYSMKEYNKILGRKPSKKFKRNINFILLKNIFLSWISVAFKLLLKNSSMYVVLGRVYRRFIYKCR